MKKQGGGGGAFLPIVQSFRSHSPYTLPSSVSRKSFICHSYENTGGVGVFFPFWFTALSVAGACEPAWVSLPTLPFQLSIEDPGSVATVDRRSRLGRDLPLCLYSTGHGSPGPPSFWAQDSRQPGRPPRALTHC